MNKNNILSNNKFQVSSDSTSNIEPKVSIIVPVYNVLPYIRKCVDSLLSQTLKEIEIILVDDGSSDGSEKIVDEYLELYPDKIKVIHEENAGQGTARNNGIKISKGQYLGFVDSDDYVSPTMYEDMYNTAKMHDSDIVCCDCNLVDEIGILIKEDIQNYKEGTYDLSKKPDILFLNPAVTNKLIRSSLIKNTKDKPDNASQDSNLKENLKIKFRSKKWYEDFDFGIKLYLTAKTCSIIHKPYYYYVQRAGSTMNNKNINRNLEIIEAMDEIIKFANQNKIYNKYYEEIEYIAILNVFKTTIKRIYSMKFITHSKEEKCILKNNQKDAVNAIRKYMDINFKGYIKNKYIHTKLSKKERFMLDITYLKMYNLLSLVINLIDIKRRKTCQKKTK